MRAEERISDEQEAMKQSLEGHMANIWTAIPAIIKSVDYSRQTLTAQPSIMANITDVNQDTTSVKLPLLVDVPFQCFGGNGFVITMPNLENSECLIVFSSRCIDSWWQSGGVQVQAEERNHDLSDGMAIIGFNSLPQKIANYSTTASEFRTRDGATKISLENGKITVIATTVTVNSTTTNINATGTANITAPTTTVKGNLVVTGALNVAGGITGAGAITSSSATIGGISFAGHKHGGVATGSGITGVAQ